MPCSAASGLRFPPVQCFRRKAESKIPLARGQILIARRLRERAGTVDNDRSAGLASTLVPRKIFERPHPHRRDRGRPSLKNSAEWTGTTINRLCCVRVV